MQKKQIPKKDVFKDYIEGRFEKLGRELIMSKFININFSYIHEREKNQSNNTVFRIHYVSSYHQALISVYPQAKILYDNENFNILDSAIVHELCHVHTTDLADLAHNRYATEQQIINVDEELTETMAQYVLLIKKLKGIK